MRAVGAKEAEGAIVAGGQRESRRHSRVLRAAFVMRAIILIRLYKYL